MVKLWTRVIRAIPSSECNTKSATVRRRVTTLCSAQTEEDSHKYATILQKCIKTSNLKSGKSLHCEIIKLGISLDLFATNILLNMYSNAPSHFPYALKLFDRMPHRNTITYVTLLQGCIKTQQHAKAIQLFRGMHSEGCALNPFVFTTLFKLVVSMGQGDFHLGLHCFVVKVGLEGNAFVGTALLDAYSVCGFVGCARAVFDGVRDKDMVVWTGMVGCYAENGWFVEALRVFSEMRRVAGFMPNHFTFASVIKACVGMEGFEIGRGVHGCVVKMRYEVDCYVSVSLLDLYTKFGVIEDGRRVFDEILKKDVIPWSFMIARYAQSDRSVEALEVFCQMRDAFVVPNQFTFASVLQACASMEALGVGRQIHGLVVKVGLDSDIFVSNALMDVYAKCGDIDRSMEIFLSSPYRNDVTWNTIIVGYVQLGDWERALSLFSEMLDQAVEATEVTYSTVLRACASITALEPALQIHSLTVKTIYDKDVVVSNALIDTYAKCGCIKEARQVFETMNRRDEVSWNAMITGYSMHGLGVEALKLFEMMKESECKPNKLTFVGVLSACSNAGLLEHGQAYFNSMTRDYNIVPCMEHYTCMVWLLGRSGLLNRALKLIEEIPFEPSVMAWRALLGACVIHNDVELGKISAQRVLELEPQDEAAHVLLSNIYANARKWGSVVSVRKNMKKKGLKKEPGLSWIEYQGTVHYFTVGDDSHPDIKLIRGMLEQLRIKAKRAGFVPDRSAVLRNVEDTEKEQLLWLHSERLALAFGLVRLPAGAPIRIIKNLRICVDCHAAVKLLSRVVDREFVIRDMNRFHHFHHGTCSCGDYW